MKVLILALSVVVAICGKSALADSWQPSPRHTQVPIWPGAVPDAIPNPKPESIDTGGGVFDVSLPTMTVYAAKDRNTGVAVVVFRAEATRLWPCLEKARHM